MKKVVDACGQTRDEFSLLLKKPATITTPDGVVTVGAIENFLWNEYPPLSLEGEFNPRVSGIRIQNCEIFWVDGEKHFWCEGTTGSGFRFQVCGPVDSNPEK